MRDFPDFLATGTIPQMRGVVKAHGQELLAVRRERHAPYPIGKSFEDMHGLPSRNVPQPRRLVGAAREHLPTIGREGDRWNPVTVADEHAWLGIKMDVPQARHKIAGGQK